MNEILKTRNDINEATKWLQDRSLIESGISAKNWEAVQVLPLLKDGDLLDMGSAGGIILENAVLLGIAGKKFGIDLAYAGKVFDITDSEIMYVAGDLMNCPFSDESFDTVISLSVIEHEVKYDRIAKEVGRLLRQNGTAFISFDYWTPKPDTSKTRLYDLSWNILDVNNVLSLIQEFKNNGMELTSDINWTTQDAVINPAYCSPAAGVEYSFLILQFIKK